MLVIPVKKEEKVVRTIQKGFTLIELLISIAVIGILLGGTFYLVRTVQENARYSASKTKLLNLQGYITLFESHVGEMPRTLEDLMSDKGRGPYAKKEELKDGWGIKFEYVLTPEGKNPYELFSYGGSAGKRTPKNKRIRIFEN